MSLRQGFGELKDRSHGFRVSTWSPIILPHTKTHERRRRLRRSQPSNPDGMIWGAHPTKEASRICTVSWALRDASPEVPILDEAVAAGRMFVPNLVDRELVALQLNLLTTPRRIHPGVDPSSSSRTP
jgi:hypothetical protein